MTKSRGTPSNRRTPARSSRESGGRSRPVPPHRSPGRLTWRAAGPWLVCAGLVAATLAVFGGTVHFPFVDFDDLTYVVENRQVTAGLTPDSVLWAFTRPHEGYWAPLLWLSYMTDVSLAGLDAGQFHLTNVVLHAASACLLFGVLLSMTGAFWRSTCVAAVFAVHPLHVESVAWVAERKDVLSGLFWMLTVAAWVRYTRKPTLLRYAVVFVTFACGLMSKPMLVTLPVILLLLDVWPLGRTAAPGAGPAHATAGATPSFMSLVREKIPLALLACAAALVTVAVQGRAGAVATLESVPVGLRAANALVSCVWYLGRMAWPAGLAPLYPVPASLPLWQVAGSVLVLGAVSWLVWRVRRRLPFAGVGWLWYLVMLVPVLGLLQAGPQARADRYTYLSMSGIAIIVVWGLAGLGRTRASQRALALGACVVLVSLGVAAHRQTQVWRTSEAVFRRAIDVTAENPIALSGLATALTDLGRFEEAVPLYGEAIRLRPGYAEAYGNLGHALLELGRPGDALPNLREAIRLNPGLPEFHLDLGTVLNTLGEEGAEAAYREALRLDPDSAAAHSGLGVVLAGRGDTDGAMREFSEAIRLDPGYVDARHNLGLVLVQTGQIPAAVAQFREAVRLSPESGSAHATLGRLLATQARYAEAEAALTQAIRLEPADAHAIDSLGGVHLVTGRLDEAVARFSEAVRLRPDVPEFRVHLDRALAERRKR